MGILSDMKRFVSGVFTKRAAIFGRKETVYTGTTRDSDIVGAIAHVIAKNVGKLTPQVIRKTASGTTIKNDKLAKLISLRPNAQNTIYDFLYKMASDLVYNSNAFAVCFYNDDFTELLSIEPVTVTSHSIFEHEGNLFFKFTWEYDNHTYIVPYQFVIHIKSRYNNKRFFGTPPDAELTSSLEMLDTTYAGIKKIINNSASLRGYLKFNNLIDDERLRTKVQEFKEAYFNAENEGGVAGLDNTFDFHELQQKTPDIPSEQIAFYRENIYRYYNVNEKILNSSYSESEWNAFYEAVIEPIAIALSLEFTFKIFSEGERSHGNKVIFTTNRLQYATLQVRNAIASGMFEKGIITINEYRQIMYMSEIPDGDVRMISLNYVKVDDQTAYQLGNNAEKGGDEDKT